MAGYSGTPLPKKLGIREGMSVAILDAPSRFRFEPSELPDDVEFIRDEADQPADIFLVFGDRAAEVERTFHLAMTLLQSDGSIWVAWPKKSSGVETDISEDTLRAMFLPTGMVDNKVCAIDETWSGLRFVVRKENRSEWGRIRG